METYWCKMSFLALAQVTLQEAEFNVTYWIRNIGLKLGSQIFNPISDLTHGFALCLSGCFPMH